MPVFNPQKFRTSFKALKNPMKSLKNNPSDGLPYYLQYIFVWFLPRILLQKASTPLGHMEASHACFQSCTCLQHHLSSVHPSFVAAAFQLSESQFQPAKKKMQFWSHRWSDCNSATNRLRLSDKPQWYDKDLCLWLLEAIIRDPWPTPPWLGQTPNPLQEPKWPWCVRQGYCRCRLFWQYEFFPLLLPAPMIRKACSWRWLLVGLVSLGGLD